MAMPSSFIARSVEFESLRSTIYVARYIDRSARGVVTASPTRDNYGSTVLLFYLNVTHVISLIMPSRFSACNIEKLE